MLKAERAALLLCLFSFVFHLEKDTTRPTEDRALSLRYASERVTPRSVTFTRGYLSFCARRVLPQIILDGVSQKVLIHEGHEQSGVTPKKSTVDRILALRVFVELLRDWLLAAYMDLRKALDSVNRDCILENRGFPWNTPRKLAEKVL